MSLVHYLDAVKPTKTLTARQLEFCIQFVLTSNKAKAARSAGYALRNSSSIGCRLLKRQDILDHIRALRAEAQQRTKTPTVDNLADEYAQAENQTLVSLAAFIDLSGGLLRLREPNEITTDCNKILDYVEMDPQGRVTGYRLKDGGLPSLQRMLSLSGDHADQ